jgi:hypothetical protein
LSGRAADWAALNDGEEFSVGPHRFRAERAGAILREVRS